MSKTKYYIKIVLPDNDHGSVLGLELTEKIRTELDNYLNPVFNNFEVKIITEVSSS